MYKFKKITREQKIGNELLEAGYIAFVDDNNKVVAVSSGKIYVDDNKNPIAFNIYEIKDTSDSFYRSNIGELQWVFTDSEVYPVKEVFKYLCSENYINNIMLKKNYPFFTKPIESLHSFEDMFRREDYSNASGETFENNIYKLIIHKKDTSDKNFIYYSIRFDEIGRIFNFDFFDENTKQECKSFINSIKRNYIKIPDKFLNKSAQEFDYYITNFSSDTNKYIEDDRNNKKSEYDINLESLRTNIMDRITDDFLYKSFIEYGLVKEQGSFKPDIMDFTKYIFRKVCNTPSEYYQFMWSTLPNQVSHLVRTYLMGQGGVDYYNK